MRLNYARPFKPTLIASGKDGGAESTAFSFQGKRDGRRGLSRTPDCNVSDADDWNGEPPLLREVHHSLDAVPKIIEQTEYPHALPFQQPQNYIDGTLYRSAVLIYNLPGSPANFSGFLRRFKQLPHLALKRHLICLNRCTFMVELFDKREIPHMGTTDHRFAQGCRFQWVLPSVLYKTPSHYGHVGVVINGRQLPNRIKKDNRSLDP